MKIENLKEGMVLKNYPELCRVLEVDVKSGDSKVAQLSWFDDYFTYEKKGNRFIIKEIISTEIEPMQGRGGSRNMVPYITYIEKLLLDLMVRNGVKQKLVMSRTQLIKSLHMSNLNYGTGKGNTKKVASLTEIDLDHVDDWFNTTGGLLEGNINRAIKSLENQSYISSNIVTVICVREAVEFEMVPSQQKVYDRNGKPIQTFEKVVTKFEDVYRECTNDEEVLIIETERKTLEKMGYKNKQSIIAAKMWDSFIKKVNDQLSEESGIRFYYKAYNIKFSRKYVPQRAKQLDDLLTDDERDIHRATLNESIIKRIKDNAQKRQDRANRCFGKPRSFRAKEEYIGDVSQLNGMFINPESPDIRKQITEQNLKRNN